MPKRLIGSGWGHSPRVPLTLPEDIKTFLSLHHRRPSLTEEERAQYEALRKRVEQALRDEAPGKDQRAKAVTPVPAE